MLGVDSEITAERRFTSRDRPVMFLVFDPTLCRVEPERTISGQRDADGICVQRRTHGFDHIGLQQVLIRSAHQEVQPADPRSRYVYVY